eukprot:jgi/Orpsp1_1/1175496/evm.model.c7180000054094.1
MKASLALIATAALAAKASAACWSQSLGYKCCSSANAEVLYVDDDGKWSVENDEWCGIPVPTTNSCWSLSQGYPCCKTTTDVAYSDESGDWGVENGDWCGIATGGSGNVKPNPPEDDEDPVPGTPYKHSGNPFKDVTFFLNPYYVAEVDNAITQMSDPSLISKAEKMKTFSNAIWLDTIKNMQQWLETNLKGALKQQNSTGDKVLTVFVVYDLPGRDCHALASNGELLANAADAERYKTEYIDVIYEKLNYYNSQPVVLIVEPDSLANLVTNLDSTPACRDSESYYLDGHAYLIKKLG